MTADESAAPAPGDTFAGRYRIIRELGRGAMGAVYLAEHEKIGRRTAIKVLLGPLAADQEAVRRFARGARNAARIHHPNVAAVYDFGDTAEGLQFLAMEFVEGTNLADLIEQDGSLELTRVLEITRQTCSALQAAHDLGIVHRDLKPGNIMLARDAAGRELVKVVDFDIAKDSSEAWEGEVTRVGFVIGTPEYMSPEQLTGEELDGRSDIYSLGIILCRAATGRFPFPATTVQDLMLKRLTDAPLSLAELAPGRRFPMALQRALDQALEKKPADRWSSPTEFAAAFAGAETVAPLDPPSGEATLHLPATRVVERPPSSDAVVPTGGVTWKTAAMGVGAVGLLAVVGLQMLPGGTPDPDANAVVLRQEPLPQDTVADTLDTPIRPQEEEEVPTEGGGGGSENDDPPPEPPPTPTLTEAAATAMAERLQDGILEFPGTARLRVLADSSRTLWEIRSLSAALRGRAAFIHAQAQLQSGDRTAAERWAREAVALDPDESAYRTFLASMIGS